MEEGVNVVCEVKNGYDFWINFACGDPRYGDMIKRLDLLGNLRSGLINYNQGTVEIVMNTSRVDILFY